jgi:hypothetical protein
VIDPRSTPARRASVKVQIVEGPVLAARSISGRRVIDLSALRDKIQLKRATSSAARA